jgi:CMP-N,N'-diacetyllegionaminic acid synthase
MSNNIAAMVPVRAGSMRIKDKNTRPFADTNLLSLKLKLLQQLNGLASIVVTTDCDVCAEIAKSSGVEIQWRDKFYAGSSITNDLHWYNIAANAPGDDIFLAQVTSPLLRVSTMQSALDLFKSLDVNDSLNSVSSEKKFLWHDGKTLNYDENTTPKSQDLPEIVSLNFAITMISKKVMMERKNVVGYQPKFFNLDKIEAFDIDDESDFEIAESVYTTRGLRWLMD